MAHSTRIVIETSSAKKEALDTELQKRGITLADWFDTKVDEIAPIYNIDSTTQTNIANPIQNLGEIADAINVLAKINALDWAFTDFDTTYLTHNLHPYPAKFIPQIPSTLIRLLSLKGERVWDPFGGSGTTALESLLLGRQAISSDLHPIASLVGKAKTLTLTSEDETSLADLLYNLEVLSRNPKNINELVNRHKEEINQLIPSIPNIDKWFDPTSINELAYLRLQIKNLDTENSKLLADAIFSKIIVKVSFQDGETRYVSKPREIKCGLTILMFHNELQIAMTKMVALSSLLQFRKADFITADLRKENVVEPNSIDLIVTSPPYPNATDYHLYHRFRLFWLGFDPRDLAKKEIGSHLRHQKENTGIESYLSEMSSCLEQMNKGLKPGRYAILVLGEAKFNGEFHQTAELVGECAKNVGFEFIGIVSREVHLTKRSFASSARRLREEKLLVLRKPLKKDYYHLLPPPYKLWLYEEVLRRMEIERLFHVQVSNDTLDLLPLLMTPLEADRLKRLTFTHGFWSDSYQRESTWQAILENGDAFLNQPVRKDSKYITHGLHPYKGKFYPQLAKSLFNIAKLEPGQSVLDPFCGSGTVLLEGYLNGLKATGFDLNPLATKIARAKTSILQLDPRLVDRLLSRFIHKLDFLSDEESNLRHLNEDYLDELKSWFPQIVLNKLGWIINEIDQTPDPIVREFLEICLSSTIRDISQQDPKDLRIRRRKEPLEDAPVNSLLIKKLLEQRCRLRDFAKRTDKAPVDFINATVIEADSRLQSSFYNANIAPNSIDAVVTSPPYATALPYIDTDRLSILLLLRKNAKERQQIEKDLVGSREILKMERSDVDAKIKAENFANILSSTAVQTITNVYNLNHNADVGFRRKNTSALLYRYYSDMTNVLSNLNEVVAKNGSLFFVIGDNKTIAGGREIIIKSSQALQETGERLGWKLMDVVPITVTQENRLHNKNSITENDIIWFTKS
jgi:DNA modification methylase